MSWTGGSEIAIMVCKDVIINKCCFNEIVEMLSIEVFKLASDVKQMKVSR